MGSSDVILIILAIFFPPAAVAFITGCSCDLIINILLSILGWLPGTVHALWLIYRKMKAEEQYGYGAIKYQGNGDWVPDPNRAYYPAQPAHGQYAAPPHYGATA